jgi:hypothetical protein
MIIKKQEDEEEEEERELIFITTFTLSCFTLLEIGKDSVKDA